MGSQKEATTWVYDRDILVDVLTNHYPVKMGGCGCGWREFGKSHSEHVANVYEEFVNTHFEEMRETDVETQTNDPVAFYTYKDPFHNN